MVFATFLKTCCGLNIRVYPKYRTKFNPQCSNVKRWGIEQAVRPQTVSPSWMVLALRERAWESQVPLLALPLPLGEAAGLEHLPEEAATRRPLGIRWQAFTHPQLGLLSLPV